MPWEEKESTRETLHLSAEVPRKLLRTCPETETLESSEEWGHHVGPRK